MDLCPRAGRVQLLTLLVCRIRLGTFNVNGKLPSQDLSPWVRGRLDQTNSTLPTLKNVSPLSMGEVSKSSGDYTSGADGAHAALPYWLVFIEEDRSQAEIQARPLTQRR